VCDLETIGSPSIFKLIRKVSVLSRMFPTLVLNCESCGGRGRIHWKVPQCELLKLKQKGQFPDEFVKIEDTKFHSTSVQTF
jgi:hypothetical protein